MKIFKVIKKCVFDNVHLILGIIIGIYVSSFISRNLDILCEINSDNNNLAKVKFAQEIINSSINRLAPRILPEKLSEHKKPNFIRPRYYSTELGIREKLFVGIFTSEEKVNSQAIYINKTIGHLVDKIKFFITAQYRLKNKFNLTGLVGFTDARTRYRPFQVIKYIADTFGNDYDYYFFAHDYVYINAQKLRDVVNKISVSMDVYLGKRIYEGSYCNLDSGILISNSVLKAARKDLEWCIMNSVSDSHSENFGRCIQHSMHLSCQESIQGKSLATFKLKHLKLESNFNELIKDSNFNKAVTVYPVISSADFFTLNSYFLKQLLEKYNHEIAELSKNLNESWPPGQRTGAIPATRFDMPKQLYFNKTHVFFPDDFTILRPHTEAELLDINNILENVIAKVMSESSQQFEFRRLINGYKTFDLSRGLDYTIDLGFKDLNSGREIVKRFEICKPLGIVEFVPVPYVTENTRVSIIVPIQENEITQSFKFLNDFESKILKKHEKILLLLVLVYQFNSESKGTNDIFAQIKEFVKDTTLKHADDEIKISWLSIRLPEVRVPLKIEENSALNFAIVDLALRKIGLDALTLVLDIWSNITIDFLNRVRMNTILNYQIYSPIPFRQYNTEISQISNLDVNKMTGHFDREEYKYIAFYGKDYVAARKKIQQKVPLIRIDNDITQLFGNNNGNIFEMFVQTAGNNIHCMRATEMNLKVLYHTETNMNKLNKFYGNNAQLAKVLLTKEENIPELANNV